MPDYSKGVIYKIVYDGKAVYIGSTTTPLSRRMAGHRSDSKTRRAPFYEYVRTILPNGMVAKDGFFNIFEVCKFGCNSIAELEAKEYEVLNEFLARGEFCYNDKINGKISEQAKAKMSISHTGKVFSEERKVKISGENNWRFSSGSVFIKNGLQTYWVFSYRKDGKHMSPNYYSIKKLGYLKAKELAIADRLKVYPNYIPSEEDRLKHEQDLLEYSVEVATLDEVVEEVAVEEV